MGKKKAFIDKRKAVTYSLVHRAAEYDDDSDEAERVLVPNDELKVPAGPPADPSQLYRHFFGDEEDAEPLSDARKRELLEYGFPDDGYDYLKHCRVLGRSQAALEAVPSGSQQQTAASTSSDPAPTEPVQSVYLNAPKAKAPTADVKVVDARRVQVADSIIDNPAQAEPEAAGIGGSAAARELRGHLAADLHDIERLMAEAEALYDAEDAEEGVGDLLDDFVASAAAATDIANAASTAARGAQLSDDVGSDTDTGFEDDSDDQLAAAACAAGPNPNSRAVANPAAFDSLNAQFEHLVGAYDDDYLGDLEEVGGAAGKSTLQDFDMLLHDKHDTNTDHHGSEFDSADEHEDNDEFDVDSDECSSEEERDVIGNLHTCGRGKPTGVAAPKLGSESKVASFEERDEEVIAATRARLAAQANSSSSGRGDADLGTMFVSAPREQWDCESVLSLRSCATHHPARIPSEPARSSMGGTRAPGGAVSGAAGLIKISPKTGLPEGYNGVRAGTAVGVNAASGGPLLPTAAAIAAATAAAAAAATAGTGQSVVLPEHDDDVSMAPSMFERSKDETPEDRKARKAAVKAAQRDARATKKQLKMLYRHEACKQSKQGASATKGTTFAID
eukprot:jgi/Chrzof1/11652/Cz06g03220.t1